MEISKRLEELAEKIEKNKAPQVETIRTILSWFGIKRRGVHVLSKIERTFFEKNLVTVPTLSEPWIDGTVEINLSIEGKKTSFNYDSMIARLVHLDAANQKPVFVKKESNLSEAVAKMLANDFSQLPVMKSERAVEGFISWRSIGEATALGKECKYVSQCMENGVEILDSGTSLTDAIDQIISHEFIMVRGDKSLIYGPVTTTDLSVQYHKTAYPFLLVGQIEAAIRTIFDALAPQSVLQSAKHGDDEREINKPEDLTFSEYKTVLSNDEVWSKLNINLCKKEVLKLLEDVRVARNDVMHFHPDEDDSNDSIIILKNAARLFDKLAKEAVNKSYS